MHSVCKAGETIHCEECGSTTRPGVTSTKIYHDGRHFIVKNVPALVCRVCGAGYIEGPTLVEIEKSIDGKKSKLSDSITVELVRLRTKLDTKKSR